MGYAVAARLLMRGSRNVLQGSGREIHYFLGGPLANVYGNICNLWFSRG